MADHLREQILDAVVTNVTGLATTGANVHRFRFYPQGDANLPSLNVLQGTDDPVDDLAPESVYHYVDRRLTVFVEARAQATTGQVDETLNQIAKEVTVALKSSITQGISSVRNTVEGPTEEPEASEEGSKKTAMLVMTWYLDYRTSRTDPSI